MKVFLAILLSVLAAALLLVIATAGCYIAIVIITHLLYKHFGDGGKDEHKS